MPKAEGETEQSLKGKLKKEGKRGIVGRQTSRVADRTGRFRSARLSLINASGRFREKECQRGMYHVLTYDVIAKLLLQFLYNSALIVQCAPPIAEISYL